MPAEHLSQVGCVNRAIEPGIQLLARAGAQPVRHPFRQRAEAAGQQAGQGFDLAFELPFELPLRHPLLAPLLDGQALHAGDVFHLGLPFDVFDILPDLVLHLLGQSGHPVDDGEQVDDALAFPALPVEQSHQLALGGEAAAEVTAGSQGAQVRRRHQGEAVGLALECRQMRLEVQQLRRRKVPSVQHLRCRPAAHATHGGTWPLTGMSRAAHPG